MQRYFLDPEQFTSAEVYLEGEEAKHISKVMRMEEGDQIICLDNKGRQALCVITEVAQGLVKANIKKELDHHPELPIKVTIAQALIKGDKLDYVIQKGTEFGASSFTLYAAERSVVKWDRGKSRKKLDRLKKIAKEAAEQSERLFIPEINYCTSLEQLIADHDSGPVIALHEDTARSGKHKGLRELFNSHLRSLFVLVGPEGGFSEKEANWMHDYQVNMVSLGPRILRSESAALYLLAALSYQYELSR
ncbi:RsmE family RNA methyltransferase [Alteribacillus iranensis]|uniref:Ribosomal RNA small subunit methyltransferase E n=1 Tax=Alteribacillus iranensis TaxID=930128 RepID=A0A1I1ZBR7_9BACI|nr:RsmE family RNA methyltransferase [Alteribacillus iranensis]SFE28778.1 16S rRNA (uracil1498-N3)-methyltransferase [Alteribacillus iranensis]